MATCPVHKIEMRLTSREELPAKLQYYLCPKWGCVQRYRERDGYFTTLQLVEKLDTQTSA
jgi:hypothetical protein